jgi:hypothetical protein
MHHPRGLLLLLCLAGCATLEAPGAGTGNEIPALVIGEWGGEHLGLVATDAGADLEYDCATGRIIGPVRPDGSGRFSSPGQFLPGHGGPSGVGGEHETLRARYEGTVRGDTMTLTVTLTDTSVLVGTFTLTRGVSSHVFKCL